MTSDGSDMRWGWYPMGVTWDGSFMGQKLHGPKDSWAERFMGRKLYGAKTLFESSINCRPNLWTCCPPQDSSSHSSFSDEMT